MIIPGAKPATKHYCSTCILKTGKGAKPSHEVPPSGKDELYGIVDVEQEKRRGARTNAS